jgi:hypothetical protein
MNKVAKVGTRSKAAVKPVKTAAKKTVKGVSEPKPDVVPLAEVEVLAAKTEKMIKATRKLSATEKAERLERLAERLARARGWGGLSKSGAWMLAHMHEPVEPYDIRAVLR